MNLTSFLGNPEEMVYTYYYPAEPLMLEFRLNTKEPSGPLPVAIRIKKIYIPREGNNLWIYYEYTNIDSVLAMEYKVIIPLKPAYDGFYMSGGPIQDLGFEQGLPWKYWKNFAQDSKDMPSTITLTPLHGKNEFKRKAEMLGNWKKAWSRHLVDIWGTIYPDMQVKTTWVPGFSQSFKTVEKFPDKANKVFLFTKFVKDKAAVVNTAVSEGEGFKPQLKF